jgi:hypothetical protein
MPPIAEDSHPSQDNLNNAEDLEAEESDEYDVEVGWKLFCIFFLSYVTS